MDEMEEIPEYVIGKKGKKEYFKEMGIMRWYEIFVMPNVMGKENMSQEERNQVLKSSESLFINSFTHETFDLMNNYEVLENYGDSLLKGLFSGYIRRKFPDMNESQISKMSDHYSSNSVQRKILSKTGASHIIRSAKGMDVSSIIPDVFEAIFAAVFLGFEKVFPKYAYFAITNLFAFFYSYITIDTEFKDGDYKTRVVQFFDKFNHMKYKKLEEKTIPNSEKESITVTVTFVSDNYKALANYGFIIPKGEKIEASASAKFTQDGKAKVYKDIYNQLLKLKDTNGDNFSLELVAKKKLKKDFEHKHVRPYYLRALERARNENLKELVVYDSQKASTKTSKVKILAAADINENTVRLGVVNSPYVDGMKDRFIGIKTLLENYAANGKTDEFIDLTLRP